MMKALVSAAMLASVATAASAQSSIYYEVEDLYNAAAVPSTTALNSESMWTGKCVYLESDSNVPSNGLVFFHVNRDPVLGDTFYFDPVFNTPLEPAYDHERGVVLDDIACGRVRTPVTFDQTEKAWRVDYERSDNYWTYFLRQGKTQSGAVAFFLKMNAESGSQRDSGTKGYCYFYQTNPQGGAILVPPPAN